jgi:hypothetical protein
MFVYIVIDATHVYWEMEMSRITNADPIKRGSALSSTQLNQQFTEANAAFPMDGDNVRNEGLDQPAFDLNNATGKSGVILVAAAKDSQSTPVTVSANTLAAPSSDPAVNIQEWLFLQPVTNADVIRVYWQFDYQTTANDDVPVNDVDKNGCVWAIWLEYKDSGGSWAPVPNQGDMSIPNNARTLLTYGCTIVPHTVVLYDTSASATRVLATHPSTGYGDWIYSPPSTLNIHGLRLQIRGLLSPGYQNLSAADTNCWVLERNTGAAQQNTVSRSDMSYLVMRKQ